MALSANAGGFLGLMLNHSLSALIEQQHLTVEVAEYVGTVFNFFLSAAFIFVALDIVIGKKLSNIRLILVSNSTSDRKGI